MEELDLKEHICSNCGEFMSLIRSDERYHFFVCPEDHDGLGEVVEPVLIKDFEKSLAKDSEENPIEGGGDHS